MNTTAMARMATDRARSAVWAGRILSGVAIAALLMDTAGKLLGFSQVVQGTVALGYPEDTVLVIGLIELGCLLVYALPRTSLFGAVLITGYLGGAVATHVRLDNPLFTHVLSPVYVAAFVWGGLYLRSERLRRLLRP